MKYQILKKTGLLEIETEVKKFIEVGWKPQGGLFKDVEILTMRTTENGIPLSDRKITNYYQAMIKE